MAGIDGLLLLASAGLVFWIFPGNPYIGFIAGLLAGLLVGKFSMQPMKLGFGNPFDQSLSKQLYGISIIAALISGYFIWKTNGDLGNDICTLWSHIAGVSLSFAINFVLLARKSVL